MKNFNNYNRVVIFVIASLVYFNLLSCSAPNVKMPQPLPSIVKQYKHIKVLGNTGRMQKSGVYVNKGDVYSIVASGSIDFCVNGGCSHRNVRPSDLWVLEANIGNKYFFTPKGTDKASYSGELAFKINDSRYDDNAGFFDIDIIVYNVDDYNKIVDFLIDLKRSDPKNKSIQNALENAIYKKTIYSNLVETSKEIEVTKKQIEELKMDPGKTNGNIGVETDQSKLKKDKKTEKEKEGDNESRDKTVANLSTNNESEKLETYSTQISKDEKLARLEAKLASLMETLAELEGTKEEIAHERKKTSQLKEQLEEKEKREKELLSRLDSASKGGPVIVIASPEESAAFEVGTVVLHGVAEDDDGIADIEFLLNNVSLTGRQSENETGVKARSNRMGIQKIAESPTGPKRDHNQGYGHGWADNGKESDSDL